MNLKINLNLTLSLTLTLILCLNLFVYLFIFERSVFSVSEDVVTVMTPSDCRWLQVEFHTHTTQEEEEKEGKVMKIPAAGSTVGKYTHKHTLKHT